MFVVNVLSVYAVFLAARTNAATS